MSIKVEVSVGEFLDKLTILQIKAARINDTAAQANIQRELAALTLAWSDSAYARGAALDTEIAELRRINETLWDLEDRIRAREAARMFDAEFVELARSVYRTNDRRAVVKREINLKTGSGIVEEKSYTDYPHDG